MNPVRAKGMMTVLVNGEEISIEGSARQPSLLDVLGAVEAPAQPFAVALNATFVPRGRYSATPVSEGDCIDLVIAAQGG